MSTVEPMLSPPSPLAWEPLPHAASRRWIAWALPVIAFVALLISSQTVVPYVALAPGSAREISDLVSVPPDKAFPPKGQILLTTVAFQQEVTALDAFRFWLDEDIDVFPREQVLGKATPTQFRQQNLAQIDDSKQTAVVVALRRLGHKVEEHGEGTLVVTVLNGSPADGVIEPGDVIVGVDGVPTPLNQQARSQLAMHKPGEVATLDILPAGQEPKVTRDVRLAARDDGTAVLGVELRTKGLRFDLPFDVSIDSVGIGGPSAGLAFTLQLLDVLTPGELTAGKRVAVTGGIGSNGEVVPIGGIAQKVAAVEREDADVFIVPALNYKVAKARADKDLQIISVATLEEALTALGRMGGDVAALGPAPGPTDSAR